MKVKYYLKAPWQRRYTQVTREQYIATQKKIGAFDDEGETTAFFEKHGISGKTIRERE